MVDTVHLLQRDLTHISFLPSTSHSLLSSFISKSTPSTTSPYTLFHQDLQSIQSTILAIQTSLSHPSSLIESMTQASSAIDRHLTSLRRSDRWPLGLLDGTRTKIHSEAASKVEQATLELAALGAELRYTQQVVAGELAGWQDLHEKLVRRAIRELTRRMVQRERCRLVGMVRALKANRDTTMGDHQ